MSTRLSLLASLVMAATVGWADALSEPPDDVGRSADWTLAVRDPTEAEARIRSALQAHGGYVDRREVAHADTGDQVTLGLRVSAPSLDPFLDAVRQVGTLVREESHARDPTPESLRLNGRLASLQATERDLREQLSFLAPDQPLALDLQHEIAALRSERTDTLARRTLLEERVQYAVVRLTLLPEAALRPPTLAGEIFQAFAWPWRDPAGAVRQALAVGLGLILPYLGGVVLVAWFGIRAARGRRRAQGKPGQEGARR